MKRVVNPDIVESRLRLIDLALSDLAALGPVTAERLRQERNTLRVVERCVAHVVDVAAEINAHLAATKLGRAPRDLAESFDLAALAGAISEELAASIRRSAGLRNVVVHAYGALDLDLLAEATEDALKEYRQYRRCVARYVAEVAE